MTIQMQSARTIAQTNGTQAQSTPGASAQSTAQNPDTSAAQSAFSLMMAMLQPGILAHPAALHAKTAPIEKTTNVSESVGSGGETANAQLLQQGSKSGRATATSIAGGNLSKNPKVESSTADAISSDAPSTVGNLSAPTTSLPIQFAQMLRTVGVPQEDVKSISTTPAGAQRSEHNAPLNSATQLGDNAKAAKTAVHHGVSQTNSTAASTPKKVVTPASTNVNATLNQALPISTQTHQTSTPTVVWSAGSQDANRQFAQLLTQHVQSSDKPQTLTVQVHPQGMGTLTVTVAQNESGLNVQIQASSQQTASWLQTETNGLAQAVEAAGLAVNDVQVSVSTGQGQQQKGQGNSEDTKRLLAIGQRRQAASGSAFQLESGLTGWDGTAQSISLRA